MLKLASSVDQRGPATVFSASADAEARPGEGGAATASTDVVPSSLSDLLILNDQTVQTTLEASGDPATSTTDFEAFQIDDVAIESLNLSLDDEALAGSWILLDYWS